MVVETVILWRQLADDTPRYAKIFCDPEKNPMHGGDGRPPWFN